MTTTSKDSSYSVSIARAPLLLKILWILAKPTLIVMVSIVVVSLLYVMTNAVFSSNGNAERLKPVLINSQVTFANLAHGIVEQDRSGMSIEYGDSVKGSFGFNQHHLQSSRPELFAMPNDWLLAVANDEFFTQDEVALLLSRASSENIVTTTVATDWLLEVFERRARGVDQATGLTALRLRVNRDTP